MVLLYGIQCFNLGISLVTGPRKFQMVRNNSVSAAGRCAPKVQAHGCRRAFSTTQVWSGLLSLEKIKKNNEKEKDRRSTAKKTL
jgi:hypothetical protein